DRGGSSDSDGIRLQNASHVAVEDLVIRNADSSSPRINGCINARGATEDSPMRGNVLRNDRCIDSDAEGFYVSQFHTGLIEGNVISGAGKTGRSRAHGIYLANAGSDGTVIRGNTTSNITSPQSE